MTELDNDIITMKQKELTEDQKKQIRENIDKNMNSDGVKNEAD